MRTIICLSALLVLLALSGCLPPDAPQPAMPAGPTPTSVPSPTAEPTAIQAAPTPVEVVTSMAERFSAGDLEGGMAYWADDAIWYILGLPPTGSEILEGRDAIRAELENEIASHLRWEIDPRSVVGNVVTSHDTTWLDFTRQIGVAPVGGTGQYLVEDGKVVSYAWTIDLESLDKLKAALAEAMPAGTDDVKSESAVPAETPVSELAVTIAGGACSYEGPLTLQAGEIQLTVDVQDQDREAYAVVFMGLDPGKDFADLMAATAGTPPSWVQPLHYEELGPGESTTYSIAVADGPLYAVCWSKPPDHPIGNLGPFAVEPLTESAPEPERAEFDVLVTFSKNTCAFDGPPVLASGEVTVTMDIQDTDRASYALTFFTLDPGKTLGDLIKAQRMPAPPPWAALISYQDALPGERKTYRMTTDAGPLYMMCWSGASEDSGRVIGSRGPIEVGTP